MELREQMPRPTLAQKLGGVNRASPQFRRVRGVICSSWQTTF